MPGPGGRPRRDGPAENLIIFHDVAQRHLNRAAGEFARVWELRRDTLLRGKRVVDTCTDPIPIEFGDQTFDTVISHFPITKLLRFPPREWQIHPDDTVPKLRVDVPVIPPEWLR